MGVEAFADHARHELAATGETVRGPIHALERRRPRHGSMDRPVNLMVVSTVLWFDALVDQRSVLQVFGERVVWRFRRFRQRAADPALTLAPWAAPEWVDDAGFALAGHVSRTRLPALGDQRALQRAASDLAGRPLRRTGRCGNCTCSTAMVTAARCCCAPTTPSPTAPPSCRSCCRWPIRWTPVSTPVCCRGTIVPDISAPLVLIGERQPSRPVPGCTFAQDGRSATTESAPLAAMTRPARTRDGHEPASGWRLSCTGVASAASPLTKSAAGRATRGEGRYELSATA